MEEKELNGILSKVSETVAKDTKAAIDAFKEESKGTQSKEDVNNAITLALKGLTGEVAEGEETITLKGLEAILVKQGNLIKENQVAKVKSVTKGVDLIKGMITENAEEIVKVSKSHSVGLSLKAVADMTIGTALTGDQPREYNFDTVMLPGQLVDVADLAGSIDIGVGTYTYPRETGGEGAIATQVEGSSKAQVDYDLSMIDVSPDFIAGFARYSRKMRNNLPFLESFLPNALRRDYAIAENSAFNTVLAAAATASTQIITGKNMIEMLINEIATLETANYAPSVIVVRPADFWTIMVTEKSTGAGYGLPGVVSMDGGQLRINGIPIVKANWMAANKYYVGDWSRINKINTEGLSLAFSDVEGTNFVENNITARIESQTALAVEQPAAIIYGDFTAV